MLTHFEQIMMFTLMTDSVLKKIIEFISDKLSLIDAIKKCLKC